MSTITDRHEPFPVAPPSTSAGGHEMRDGSAAQEAPRPFIQSSSSYPTPYLGLKSRLSQVWINRWTVLLLLVLVRTLFAIASLDDNLGTARAKALSACTSVENVGSGLASMPHYLAGGVNQLSADGIEKAVNGLMKGLTLTVTGVEEIAVFYVNTLIGTYVCLVTFAVTGGLHVAVDVAEDVGNALNATAKAVGSDLSKGTQDLQNALNGFISDIEKVGSFFTGKSPTPPTVDFSSEISSLNGLQLPAGYDQGLAKLNASIPTFAEVKNLTNTAIRFPFEEVKKLLNESLPTYSLDRSLFPVPQKEQLTFCSDNNGINDFFDDLIRIEHLAKKIFIAVLVALAVLVCAPMAYREIRRWRLQQERIRFANAEAVDDIDAAYIVSRPYTASAGLALSRKFHSARAKAMVRFTVAYATTVPALFVLSLALAGLLACLCQYILLKAIEKEVPQLTAEVGAFADQVLNKLNNASEQWAIGTNNIINSTNSKINHDVFGWVNTTTTAVNNTLNLFVDGMMDGLNATFGGTPLYDPVLEVLNCLILLKVQGIEKALTWVSDNAYITFPELPVDTFSLGAMDKMSEGGNSSILATGPTDEASDAISGAVLDVMNHLQNAIRQEALISTSILVVWLIIVLIGLLQSAWFLTKRGDAPPTRPITPDGGAPGFFAPSSKVPTYEQATSEKHLPDGNTYNGRAYTLTPNPIPTFRIDQPNSPILTSGQANDEKVGTVGAKNVESVTHRPQNTRSSSYGNFAVTTPIDPPYSSKNHFLNGSSRDPFSDLRR